MDHVRVRCITIPVTVLGIVRILYIFFNNIINSSWSKTCNIDLLTMSKICRNAVPVSYIIIIRCRDRYIIPVKSVNSGSKIDPYLELEIGIEAVITSDDLCYLKI